MGNLSPKKIEITRFLITHSLYIIKLLSADSMFMATAHADKRDKYLYYTAGKDAFKIVWKFFSSAQLIEELDILS